jgi:hypothetical protein
MLSKIVGRMSIVSTQASSVLAFFWFGALMNSVGSLAFLPLSERIGERLPIAELKIEMMCGLPLAAGA